MRLLFDENLSELLVPALAAEFPGSLHVRTLGLGGAPDHQVWEAAILQQAILVTRDEDYRHLSSRRGAPPKVAWLRLGNCTTAEVRSLLLARLEDIRCFAQDSDATFLALG